MDQSLLQSRRPRRVVGWLALAPLVLALAGCGPEGAGTIKIEDSQKARARAEGAAASSTNVPAKDAKGAKVQKTIEEAIKKHPKLQ
jgi:hypothetical protein